MKSGLTVKLAATTLRAVAIAAALVCVAGTSVAAGGATLKITSFDVSAEEFSGNFAWAMDSYQSFSMSAQQGGGLYGSSSDSYTAADWNMGVNRLANTTNAMATGNLVQFTDAMTQLMTAGFNLAAEATPGAYVPTSLPNYANATGLQSGTFVLLDGNGGLASGTVTFDIYYNMSVAKPDGLPIGYSQTVLNLLSSSGGGASASFDDGLLSTSLAGGSGSTSGHFTWTYTLAAGQAAYYTLSGSAISSALAAVPEPGTYALMLAGLACIGALVRRNGNAA